MAAEVGREELVELRLAGVLYLIVEDEGEGREKPSGPFEQHMENGDDDNVDVALTLGLGTGSDSILSPPTTDRCRINPDRIRYEEQKEGSIGIRSH